MDWPNQTWPAAVSTARVSTVSVPARAAAVSGDLGCRAGLMEHDADVSRRCADSGAGDNDLAVRRRLGESGMLRRSLGVTCDEGTFSRRPMPATSSASRSSSLSAVSSDTRTIFAKKPSCVTTLPPTRNPCARCSLGAAGRGDSVGRAGGTTPDLLSSFIGRWS